MLKCTRCKSKLHIECAGIAKWTADYLCSDCSQVSEEDYLAQLQEEKKEKSDAASFHRVNKMWIKKLEHEKSMFIEEYQNDFRHFCNAEKIRNVIKAFKQQDEMKSLTIEEKLSISDMPESPAYICNATLRDYQLEGASRLSQWFARGVGGILADEMGLGKTIQTITFLAGLKHRLGCSGPHLVVTPLAVLQNWANEISKFCPSLSFKKIYGTQNERRRAIEDPDVYNCKYDIYLTTYETLVTEEAFFIDTFPWLTVTIDEGHRIKNETGKLRSTLGRLRSPFRLLLTGTPLQNNLRELWALLDYILPEVFNGGGSIFDSGFQLSSDEIDTEVCLAARRLLDVHMMLRRVKADVETSLLPKIQCKLTVPLTPFQKQWYRNILKQHISDLGSLISGEQLLNILSQLRKVVNHPKQILIKRERERLLEKRRIEGLQYAGCDFVKPTAQMQPPAAGSAEHAAESTLRSLIGERLIQSSSKLLMLDMLLKKLIKKGHRCLIFSQYTETLDVLEEYVTYRFGAKDEVFFRLDGSTHKVMRELNVRAFNKEGAKSIIYLISTTAGGMGINLATADTVILYDSAWNPSVDLQAQDRAHRIGQRQQVTVFRLVTESTFEERILQMAERKQILDSLVIAKEKEKEIEALEEGGEAQLSITQLRNLVSHGMKTFFSSGAETTPTQSSGLLDGGAAATSSGDGFSSSDAFIADLDKRLELFLSNARSSEPDPEYEPTFDDEEEEDVDNLESMIRSVVGEAEEGAEEPDSDGSDDDDDEESDADPDAAPNGEESKDNQSSLLPLDSLALNYSSLLYPNAFVPPKPKKERSKEPRDKNAVKLKKKKLSKKDRKPKKRETPEERRARDARNKANREKLRLAMEAEAARSASTEDLFREIAAQIASQEPSITAAEVEEKAKAKVAVVVQHIAISRKCILCHCSIKADEDVHFKCSVRANFYLCRVCYVDSHFGDKRQPYPMEMVNAAHRKRVRKEVRKFEHPNLLLPPKKPKVKRINEEICFCCKDGGEILCCDTCPKSYHLDCLGLEVTPQGHFTCPWHACIECDRKSSEVGGVLFRCMDCPTAFCFDCWPSDREMIHYKTPDSIKFNFESRGYDLSKNILFFRCGECEKDKGVYVEPKSVAKFAVIAKPKKQPVQPSLQTQQQHLLMLQRQLQLQQLQQQGLNPFSTKAVAQMQQQQLAHQRQLFQQHALQQQTFQQSSAGAPPNLPTYPPQQFAYPPSRGMGSLEMARLLSQSVLAHEAARPPLDTAANPSSDAPVCLPVGSLPLQPPALVHKCHLCEKSFATWQALNAHAAVHLRPSKLVAPRPPDSLLPGAAGAAFTCLVCGKAFETQQGLNGHGGVHSRASATADDGAAPTGAEDGAQTDTQLQPMTIAPPPPRPRPRREAFERPEPGEDGLYTCLKCDKKFDKLKSLYGHNTIHSEVPENVYVDENGMYPCMVCGKAFPKYNGLKAHTVVHYAQASSSSRAASAAQKPVYSCPKCARLFSTLYLLNLHEVQHMHDELALEELADKSALHVEQLHPTTEEVLRLYFSAEDAASFMGILLGGVIKCCNGEIESFHGFKWRFHESAQEVDFAALEASGAQKSFADILQSVADVDPQGPFSPVLEPLYHRPLPDENGLFHCPKCDKTFNTEAGLNLHLHVHGEKHQAMLAEAAVKREIARLEEEAKKPQPDEDGMFKCQQCDKRFTSLASVNLHAHVHGEKHQAKVAEAAARRVLEGKSIKERKKYSADDEGLYSCDKCDKKFPTPQALGGHAVYHLKSDPNPNPGGAQPRPKSKKMPREEPWEDGLFHCLLCGKTYEKLNAFAGHKGFHSAELKSAKQQSSASTEALMTSAHAADAAQDGQQQLQEEEEDDEVYIYCDGCNFECRLSHAGLETVPEGDWFCETCVGNGVTEKMVADEPPPPPPQLLLKLPGVKKRRGSTKSKEPAVLQPMAPMVPAAGRFKCGECDKTFQSLFALRGHEALHSAGVGKKRKVPGELGESAEESQRFSPRAAVGRGAETDSEPEDDA